MVHTMISFQDEATYDLTEIMENYNCDEDTAIELASDYFSERTPRLITTFKEER